MNFRHLVFTILSATLLSSSLLAVPTSSGSLEAVAQEPFRQKILVARPRAHNRALTHRQLQYGLGMCAIALAGVALALIASGEHCSNEVLCTLLNMAAAIIPTASITALCLHCQRKTHHQ